MRETPLISNKKAENMRRLVERHNGKRDLLAEWELFPDLDHDYLVDLTRRVRGLHNDIIYRGGIVEEEMELP